MFYKIKKYFAIRKILQQLPSALASRYGLNSTREYTQAQVKEMMLKEALNQEYIDYAYAVFLTPNEAIECIGDKETVFNIRMEVLQLYLGGQSDLKDLFSASTKIGYYGSCWFSGENNYHNYSSRRDGHSH